MILRGVGDITIDPGAIAESVVQGYDAQITNANLLLPLALFIGVLLLAESD